jgi:hypothetical protein
MIRKHLFFLAADKATVSPAATLEQKLTEAQNSLTAITGERDTALSTVADITQQRDAALAESTNLKAQFDALTVSSQALNTELVSVKAERDAKLIELTAANSKLTAEQENRTRLETLCGINGIDPKNAVPASKKESPTAVTVSLADFLAMPPKEQLAASQRGIKITD